MSGYRERIVEVEEYIGDEDLMNKAIEMNVRRLVADIVMNLPMKDIRKIAKVKTINVVGRSDDEILANADPELIEWLKHLRDNNIILLKGESKL